MKTLLVACLVCVLSNFDCKVSRAGDVVEYSLADDKVEFLVTSQTGIGSVHITPAVDWPASVSFRLHYEGGTAFSRLEGAGIKTEEWRASGSFRNPGSFTRDYPGQSERASDRCDIRIEQEGGIRVVLPTGLLQDRQPVTFSWIDAYR